MNSYSDRAGNRDRRLAGSAGFPRSQAAVFVLLVGFTLWNGVLSDPSGRLRTPDIGSVSYVAAVVGVTVLVAYADRKNRKRS
jgi:membrane associated rhomboid family serine protease